MVRQSTNEDKIFVCLFEPETKFKQTKTQKQNKKEVCSSGMRDTKRQWSEVSDGRAAAAAAAA